MATINAPASERRHISDRRISSGIGKTKLNALDWIAMVLMIVGGLNWGLVGVADVNLVEWLLGRSTLATRVVYVAVGIAAAYCAWRLPRWSRAG